MMDHAVSESVIFLTSHCHAPSIKEPLDGGVCALVR